METLDSDLPQMLLHAKIDQLIILNYSIVVVIVPKDVFDKIVYLCLILLQDLYKKVPYLLRLEVHIFIGIKLDDLAVDHLSDRKGQFLCLELEFLLLETLTLQF